MKRSWKLIVRHALAAVLIVVIVGPFAYASGGWSGVSYSLILGILGGILHRGASLPIRTATSVLFGIAVAFAFDPTLDRVSTVAYGFILGVARWTPVGFTQKRQTALSDIIESGLLTAALVAFPALQARELSSAIVFIIQLALFVCLGVPVGLALGRWLRPSILIYEDLITYLRAMTGPIVAFIVGYMLLSFVFAGFYFAVWRANSAAFVGGESTRTFGDFLYMSFMVCTTVGYSDVLPVSDIARTLTATEALLGVGWTTVVFAAIVSNLQPANLQAQERAALEDQATDKAG